MELITEGGASAVLEGVSVVLLLEKRAPTEVSITTNQSDGNLRRILGRKPKGVGNFYGHTGPDGSIVYRIRVCPERLTTAAQIGDHTASVSPYREISMSWDPATLTMHDPLGVATSLQKRVLQLHPNAKQLFPRQPGLVLAAIRAEAQLSQLKFTMSPAAVNNLRKLSDHLHRCEAAEIRSDLDKILRSQGARRAFERMSGTGILQIALYHVWRALKVDEAKAGTRLVTVLKLIAKLPHDTAINPQRWNRWGLLCSMLVPDEAEGMMMRLQFPKTDIEGIRDVAELMRAKLFPELMAL